MAAPLAFESDAEPLLIRIGDGDVPTWWLQVMLDSHQRMVERLVEERAAALNLVLIDNR